jgi:hypothetical protein
MHAHGGALRRLRVLGLLALSVSGAALALGAPTASADTTWTKISSDYSSGITVPEMSILGSTAVVTWEQDTSPTTEDIVSDTFQTSPANDVANGVPGKVVEGWKEADYRQALFPTTTGGLEIAFGGIHSTVTGDPLVGLIGATHNADGSWSAATTIATGSGTGQADSGVLSGAVPIVVNNSTGAIYVVVNPTGPTSTATADLQTPLPAGSDGYLPKIAVDSAGHVWVAWYSSGSANGIYVQQIDQTTGQPIGTPALAPGSNNIDNNAQGTALSCAATCRLVYIDEPAGAPSGELMSWWIGQSAGTKIASLPDTGVFSDAYRSDGKLWVAWWNGKTYSYTLGDATGAGGSVQDAGLPSGGGMGAGAIRLASVGENLLMGVNFNYKSGVAVDAIFVNDVAPPAPVTYAPGPRQTNLVSTPGGKGFRIQVQFKVPAACKPSCAAHAELRTRNGRQLYAVSATAPLPGDGKVVLGTRPSVKLPGGKKVRFYLTISKAELLKAPFTTVGGNRVANTRLRVWLTTKSGQQLAVRDGRIAVSIARIKSGALPGLAGIL